MNYYLCIYVYKIMVYFQLYWLRAFKFNLSVGLVYDMREVGKGWQGCIWWKGRVKMRYGLRVSGEFDSDRKNCWLTEGPRSTFDDGSYSNTSLYRSSIDSQTTHLAEVKNQTASLQLIQIIHCIIGTLATSVCLLSNYPGPSPHPKYPRSSTIFAACADSQSPLKGNFSEQINESNFQVLPFAPLLEKIRYWFVHISP